MPVDNTLDGVETVKNFKVMFLFKDRDGISPDELLDEDISRASAISTVVLSKSTDNTKGRFAIVYNPREWFIDPSSGKDGFLVYRSRSVFMALSVGPAFRMRRIDGTKRLSVSRGVPVISDGAVKKQPTQVVEEGWFLATME